MQTLLIVTKKTKISKHTKPRLKYVHYNPITVTFPHLKELNSS
jgi:hypothetical protein